ncbi:MAG: FadR/GntR family transcriptional regulator [Negativicutes bacterium]|nr:FadR/GntR family transcriptional regulator [Negativicutes bacterium]
MEIRPVDKSNVSDQVFDQIVQLLVSNQWAPGDKIPSENELKEIFGVSRNTIRGAIKKLNVLGLLETKTGEGTYVRKLGASIYMNCFVPAVFLDGPDFLELMEFRKGIEVEAVKLAAERATPESVREIKRLLDKLYECKDDIEVYSNYDIEFHAALAKASENKMFEKMMSIIKHLLLHRLNSYMKEQGNLESLVFHPQIVEAIEKHNPDLAGSLMNAHLSIVINRLKQQ